MKRPTVSNRLPFGALFFSFLLLAIPAYGAPRVGDEYRGWTISSLEVFGGPEESGALKSGLVLKKGAEFYPKALEQDLSRIRLHLARNGYPLGQVFPEFRPLREKRSIDLVLRIEPGRPVVVEEIVLEGIPAGMSHPIPSPLPLRKGAVFREDWAAESAGMIERHLREQGYAFAAVAWELEPRQEHSVAAAFRLEPGEIVYFRGTSVQGAAEDLLPVAVKTANVRPGTRYHPAIVAEAATNLRLLGLFRLVRVGINSVGNEGVELLADLTERKPRSIEWGLGFWTDEGIRTRARWEHRNLFRAGRGGAISGGFSRFRQNGRISMWTPTLFGSRTFGAVAVKIDREEEDSYQLREVGGELSVRRRPSAVSIRTAALSISDVQIDEKTNDPGAFSGMGGLLTTLSAGNDRNTSDDRLYPSRGSRWAVRAEWGLPAGLSENHFLSLSSQGSRYFSAWGSVLALRLAGGAAGPTDNSGDLLPNKRFYSGGANSMRGFKRRRLGPQDEEGAPIGGEVLFESSVEWRFPVAGMVNGALFADAGQVWLDRGSVRPDDMEAAVGPSLILRTPVGPIRGDWAYRLTDHDRNEPRSVFHVIVGNPF